MSDRAITVQEYCKLGVSAEGLRLFCEEHRIPGDWTTVCRPLHTAPFAQRMERNTSEARY